MRKFKDQPLGRKALTLGLIPSVSAVLFLAIASLTATYFRAVQNTQIDLEAQASVVAQNVRAALSFDDRDDADDTLRGLQIRDNIDRACVFDARGRLFASFARWSDNPCPLLLETLEANQGPLFSKRAIAGDGSQGTLVLTGNLGRFYGWVRTQALAIISALAGGVLVGFILTQRLKRAVSEPVLDLARTADAVSATRDYSLRATKTTDDEVGGLVQSFNSMLDELQRQNQVLTVEIVERKRAEELKDAFLAAVSHELRTPLNAILGGIQLLQHSRPSDERLGRALESLERNARSQARLVEDLLDVSRIVSGKFQMHIDVVDLRLVVRRALEANAPQAAAKSLDCTVNLPALPCLVSGDEDRLQQAVSNLLSNAIKFSSAGTITVMLTPEQHTREFAVSVEDHGVGIPADFLPNVFDRFRQADTSTTRRHGGLGLGLAIVKEVAELHGGSTTATSGGLGRGSTFTIRLPQLIQVDAASSSPRPDARLTGLPSLRGVSVLVVDDEPDSLDIAATALASVGAAVTRAADGAEAIRVWRPGEFDALVCDLAMPDVDGFDVLNHALSTNRASGRRFVAVALTAYASNDYRARSLDAGFHIHLAKPYSTRDLILALNDALKADVRVGAGAEGDAVA